MQLLDAFDHDGPNGTHRCLVFEAMGPSAEAMVDELPENKPKMYDRINRYPLWMAKSMLRQALLGLDFLHQNGIAHGDFQPGNILFSATDLESAGEEELAQDDQRDVSAPVRRLDGRIDPWAPRYVATSQPLAEHADLGPEFVVKLSDMGAGMSFLTRSSCYPLTVLTAFFLTDPPERPATPASLRSPEMILEGKDGLAQDVWSFGCLVFEFICARPPFVVWTAFRPKEESDDDHLLMFDDTLGPLPDAVRSKWSRSHKYFNAAGKRIKEPNKDQPEPNGTNGISNAVSTGSDHGTNETSNGAATGSANGTNRISNDIATDPEMKTNRISNGAAAISENGTNGISSEGATGSVNGADQETTQLPAFVVKEPEPEFHYPTLEDLFNQNKSPDLDADESATIKALLRQILTYDPDQRPSAAELLKHPWFAGTK